MPWWMQKRAVLMKREVLVHPDENSVIVFSAYCSKPV